MSIRRTLWKWVRGGLLVALVGALAWPLFAAAGQEPPLPGQEEPWNKEPPDVIVPGEESSGGAAFETPFLAGITALTAEFVDCVTGSVIAPDEIETEYYFVHDATPPYETSELERVIVWASGYLPREITEFETFSLNLLFLTLTMISPAEGRVLCLTPSNRSVDAEFIGPEVPAQPVPPGPPTPVPPAQCGARDNQREVWKVEYRPTSVIVSRGQNAKGGSKRRLR